MEGREGERFSNVPEKSSGYFRLALWLSLYCQKHCPLNLLFYIQEATDDWTWRVGDSTSVPYSQDASLQLQPPPKLSQQRGEDKLLRGNAITITSNYWPVTMHHTLASYYAPHTLLSCPVCAPGHNISHLLKDFPFSQFLSLCSIISVSPRSPCPMGYLPSAFKKENKPSLSPHLPQVAAHFLLPS